jgi:hypothetical protein
VDDLGDGTYEIGVRLIFDRGSYGDTLRSATKRTRNSKESFENEGRGGHTSPSFGGPTQSLMVIDLRKRQLLGPSSRRPKRHSQP